MNAHPRDLIVRVFGRASRRQTIRWLYLKGGRKVMVVTLRRHRSKARP